MTRFEFRGQLLLLCMFVVWGMAVLAAVISFRLPEQWRMLPAILPAGAVLLIGVLAANHWWTKAAALIAWPFLAVGVYSVVQILDSLKHAQDHTFADANAVASLGYGLLISIGATVLAGLGVIIGQRRYGKDRDDVDLVTDVAALVDDAWSKVEDTPADGTGPLPFFPGDIPGDSPYMRGLDGRQAADPTFRHL